MFHIRPQHFYLTWDSKKDQILIREGGEDVATATGLNVYRQTIPLIVFDELHKYRKWKTFLKGFFDKYSSKAQIIVTGSARLVVYKAGGDSLMGRYFFYRLHPFSVAEIVNPHLRENEIAPESIEISDSDFRALLEFGGFPEPFLKRDRRFFNRWKKLRFQQLFREDIRELTKIQEISEIDLLAELLQSQAGGLTNFSTLANKINVSVDTIKRWI